jgi:hypothetical protein
MTSPTQVASNRQNSTLSTGPRTEAGKIASSKNAISHGLSAADPVLGYENRADYEKLVKDYYGEYEPDTIHQNFLVSQLAGAQWRLDRIQRIENAAIDLIICAPADLTGSPDHKIAQRMLDSGGDPLPRLERYRASVERSYHRAKKELRLAQIQHIHDEARLRTFQTRQMKEFVHAAIDAPIPGYEHLKMEPITPDGRRRPAQNSAVRPCINFRTRPRRSTCIFKRLTCVSKALSRTGCQPGN